MRLPLALVTPVCALALLAPSLGVQEPRQPAHPPVDSERLDAHPDTVRIEVEKGRVVTLGQGHAARTLRRGEVGILRGAQHVEVGAGTQAELAWPGRASIRVWGPASFQWAAVPEPTNSARELASFSRRGLALRVFDVAWLDLEIRSGEHQLELPGHWHLDLGRGATQLRGLPGGPIELRLHAGRPVALHWRGDASRARPPITLYSGSCVRIDQPPPTKVDEVSRANPWERPSWPYRDRSDRPGDELLRERAAGNTRRQPGWPGAHEPVVTKARVPEFTEVTGVLVDEDPLPLGPALPGARDAAPLPVPVTENDLAPSTGRTAVQRPIDSEPELPEHLARREPERPAAFLAQQWRDLGFESLDTSGPLAVQRSDDLEVRLFSSGRRKVFLDGRASAPVWCFGPDKDYLLRPGAVAVFEADGLLRMSFGLVEVHAPEAGRPARVPASTQPATKGR